MMARKLLARVLVVLVGVGILSVALSRNVFAHCYTLDSPVVRTARMALVYWSTEFISQFCPNNRLQSHVL
jgi:hypothetical protein